VNYSNELIAQGLPKTPQQGISLLSLAPRPDNNISAVASLVYYGRDEGLIYLIQSKRYFELSAYQQLAAKEIRVP
jgi:hypothetical protein